MKKLSSLLCARAAAVAVITLFLTSLANAQAPAISINSSGPATPYPSTFTVSGLSGTVANSPTAVQVRINGFTHPVPGDVALLLEGPTGARLLLQTGAGAGAGVSNISYTFSDAGAQMSGAALQNGAVYKPTAFGALPVYPSVGAVQGPFRNYNNPGPAYGETANLASTFAGTNPNGVWKLYVMDTGTGAGGFSRHIIGWSLDITTVNTPSMPTGGFYVGNDFATKGNWSDKYGTQGYWVIGDAKNMPEWAQVSMTAPAYVWSNSTTDVRALKKVSNSNERIAAAVYTPTQTELSFNFTDGRTHRISLYIVDWDRNSRAESFALINTENGEWLDTSSADTFFGDGHYLTFQARGSFKLHLSNVGGVNAVLSGIFLDAPPSAETAASFVGVDTVTRGNWHTAYGAQGRKIIGDRVSEISYKTLSVYGHNLHTWANPTVDTRVLKKTYESERVAAAYYAPNQFGLIFDLAAPRRLALYALDWDGNSRQQTFELVDSETGAILDTQTMTNFNAGKYLVWTVKGRFTVRVKNAAATGNAVLSGVFLDDPEKPLPVSLETSGSFVGFDNYSKGNWKGKYGAQSYRIAADGIKEMTSGFWTQIGMTDYTWASGILDARALQQARYDSHIASTYYAPTEFALDFFFADKQAHRLALYSLDWEGSGRQQTFELINTETGAILDTRTISNFSGGVYVTWQVKGRVTVRVKKLVGPNAVLSGWFIDSADTPLPPAPPVTEPSAAFVGLDALSKGNWIGNYGAGGYSVVGDWASSSFPSAVQVSTASAAANSFTWAASTPNNRALKKATNNGDRIAATFYTSTQFDVDFNLTDGQSRRLALYNVDWDSKNRRQTFELINAETGELLDSRTIDNFASGVYAIWEIRGHVIVRVKNAGGNNAVLSGIFIDPAGTPLPPPPPADETRANFVALDSNTKGNWASLYSGSGYWIMQDSSSLPPLSVLQLSVTGGQFSYVWASPTTDVRALVRAPGNVPERIAATFYSPTQFEVNLNLTDGRNRILALYCLDWDNNNRQQTFEVVNTETDAVLDTRTINNFSGGVYMVWDVKGRITVRIKNAGGNNAVLSGIFLGNP